MPFDTNLRSTVLFLAIFILAFFPSAFQILLKPLLLPFEYISGNTPEPKQLPPICTCCPPANCFESSIDKAVQAEVAKQISTLQLRQPAVRHDLDNMSWFQKQFTLPSKSRGSYLITDHVVKELPEIKDYKVGLLNLFVQHTSCALSLNENWDEEVREDMSDALDRIAPEDRKGNLYRHSAEGLDDMPAHIKSALIGASVTVPISNGKLNTGTWQGIWYLEFRASRHSRKVVATIQGEKA
jgi:secondary thiamine-phosphate synthase enzyme